MIQLTPPCRIYFVLKGSKGEEYASFDVRSYRGAQFAEYELTHNDSSVRDSENGPVKYVRELKEKPLVGDLKSIRIKLTEIHDHIKWFGWDMKLLEISES